jgi:ABC-2 type transport system ATP-binding protein
MLAGLVEPSAGTFAVTGPIGLVLEENGHIPYLGARRNLELLGSLAGRLPDGAIDTALRRVGLDPADRRRVRSWSQGMRRRLTLAQALLGDPAVLLLDEPTNGLDPAALADFRRLVRDHADRGGAVLLASHALDELGRVCDRVSAMRGGRIADEPTSAPARVRIRVGSAESMVTAQRLLSAPTPGEHALELDAELHEPVPDLVRRLVAAGVDIEMVLPDAHDLQARYLGLVT